MLWTFRWCKILHMSRAYVLPSTMNGCCMEKNLSKYLLNSTWDFDNMRDGLVLIFKWTISLNDSCYSHHHLRSNLIYEWIMNFWLYKQVYSIFPNVRLFFCFGIAVLQNFVYFLIKMGKNNKSSLAVLVCRCVSSIFDWCKGQEFHSFSICALVCLAVDWQGTAPPSYVFFRLLIKSFFSWIWFVSLLL